MRWRILLSLTVVALAFVGCADSTEVVEPPDSGFPTLSIVSGQDQVAHPGEELAEPLVVQAVEMVDGKETPVAGVIANFVVTAGGGSVYAGAASTDLNGFAADYLTLGPEYGLNTVEVRSVDANGQKHVWGTFTARATTDATPPEIDHVSFCSPDPSYPFPAPADDCNNGFETFFPGDEYLVPVYTYDPRDPVSDEAEIACTFDVWIDGQHDWGVAFECPDSGEYDQSYTGWTDVQVVPAEYKGGEAISVTVSVSDVLFNTATAEAQLVIAKPKK